MNTLSPVEEFLLNSEKLKAVILDEALKVNSTLRAKIADLEEVIANQKYMIGNLQAKYNALESVTERLMAEQ